MFNDMSNKQFVVALLLVGLFSVAFAFNPTSQVILGALIGSFNLATGFYLGSSSSSADKTTNMGKVLDLAASATESKTS